MTITRKTVWRARLCVHLMRCWKIFGVSAQIPHCAVLRILALMVSTAFVLWDSFFHCFVVMYLEQWKNCTPAVHGHATR